MRTYWPSVIFKYAVPAQFTHLESVVQLEHSLTRHEREALVDGLLVQVREDGGVRHYFLVIAKGFLVLMVPKAAFLNRLALAVSLLYQVADEG